MARLCSPSEHDERRIEEARAARRRLDEAEARLAEVQRALNASIAEVDASREQLAEILRQTKTHLTQLAHARGVRELRVVLPTAPGPEAVRLVVDGDAPSRAQSTFVHEQAVNVGDAMRRLPVNTTELLLKLGPDPARVLYEAEIALVVERRAEAPAPLSSPSRGASAYARPSALRPLRCPSCPHRAFWSSTALEQHRRDKHGAQRSHEPVVTQAPDPRSALRDALRANTLDASELMDRMQALITSPHASCTEDGKEISRALAATRKLLTEDERAYVVGLAVEHCLALSPDIVAPYRPAKVERPWAWMLFHGSDRETIDSARWLDQARAGQIPNGNGAGGSQALYRRAVEVAWRVRREGAGYDEVINRLLEQTGDPGDALMDIVSQVKERAKHLNGFVKNGPRFSAFSPVEQERFFTRPVTGDMVVYRQDHCWCCNENLYALYGADRAKICGYCGWMICRKRSCQMPMSTSRWSFTGRKIKSGKCVRRR